MAVLDVGIGTSSPTANIQNTVSVKSGVQDSTGALLASDLGALASQVQKDVNVFKQQEATAASNSVIDEFTQKQLAIAEAVRTGQKSTSEADTLMRKNVAKYTSQYSSLSGDLLKRQKEITTTAGVGKIAVEGTEEEKAFNKVYSEALTLGFVTNTMSAEQKTIALSNYQKIKREKEVATANSAIMNSKIAEINLMSADAKYKQQQIDQLKEQNKEKFSRLVGSEFDAFSDVMTARTNEWVAGVTNGSLRPEDAQLQFNQMITGARQDIVRYQREGINTDGYTAFLDDFQSTYKDFVSGKVNEETMRSKIENFNNGATLMAISANPNEMAALAVSKTMSLQNPILSQKAASSLSQMFTNKQFNTLVNPNDAAAVKADKEVHSTLSLNFESLTSPVSVEGRNDLNNETVGVVKNFMDNTYTFERANQDPKAYMQLLNTFSQESFGEWFKMNKNNFTQEQVDNFKQVIDFSFSEKFNAAAQDAVTEAKREADRYFNLGSNLSLIGDTGGVVSDSGVDFNARWVGGQVAFFPTSKAGDKRVQEITTKLNKSVANTMTKVIKLGANLSGQNAEDIFNTSWAPLYKKEDIEGNNRELEAQRQRQEAV